MDFSHLVQQTITQPNAPHLRDTAWLLATLDTHGPRDETHTYDDIDYRVVLAPREDHPPILYAQRLTPPRNPNEIINRFLLKPSGSVAGALIGRTVHSEHLHHDHARPLAARAAHIALRHAPPGPIHLLCSSPHVLWLLHNHTPKGTEERELLNHILTRPDPVTACVAARSVVTALHFPTQHPPTQPTRADLHHTRTGAHLHVTIGPITLNVPPHPHLPDGVTALIAAEPHLPAHARIHLKCTPTEEAALRDPGGVLGPDAEPLQVTLRLLEQRNIHLKLHNRPCRSSS